MPANAFGQTVGNPVPDWTPRAAPPRTAIAGRFCRVEPVDPARHAQDLHDAFADAPDTWTYLPDDMNALPNAQAWRDWLERAAASYDFVWYAIVDADSGRAVGLSTYLRIDRINGSIEVGGVVFSPMLQRKPAATEAMFLMMRRVFDELGYRRYEWKCDSLNVPSRAAARRLGFTYEGSFRQHMVYRGRNRNTDWFSILDSEWPSLRAMFEQWLRPENFDRDGRQKASFSSFR